MHPKRVLRVINLLDVPDGKRKFWPQQSCVIVCNKTRNVLDVIQFYTNSFNESEKYQRLYPNSTSFFANVGDLTTIEELENKINWCFEKTDNTYILNKVEKEIQD